MTGFECDNFHIHEITDVSYYDTAKMSVIASMLSLVEFLRRAYAASYNENSVGDGKRHTLLLDLDTLLRM